MDIDFLFVPLPPNSNNKKSNGYTNNFDYRRFRARLCTHSYRKLDQGKQGSYRLVDARGLLDPLHGGSNAVSPTHAP